MTIAYSSYVYTSKGIPSCFVKLLRRWRGSIYKLIYGDLLVYLALFYLINIMQYFLLNHEQRKTFFNIAHYFKKYGSEIPVTFVLGFYVSMVVGRWCKQVFNLPWPDPVAIFVSCIIRGHDENGRKMRRTVMRYVCLSHIMVFSLISPKVKKRFPTYEHLVEAGFLVENEKQIIMTMDEICPKQPKYWMPIVWASSIFTRARKEGRIRDDFALRTLNDAINDFRNNCMNLLHYDTISLPLVYTQVVTLVVYAYFLASLLGGQRIASSDDGKLDPHSILEFYFPLFSILEFVFLMGWLKVAEELICPFGEDDDDFEINAAIDRNIQVSYLIVDEMHNRHPQLIKDQYWDEVYPVEIPGGGSPPPEHSTAHLVRILTPKSSDLQIPDDLTESKISRALLLWKRLRENRAAIILLGRHYTDSEHTFSERFVNKHQHSFISSNKPSRIESEEEEEEEEEEGVEIEGYTFERLREERERERIERQHQKVQRTVENAAEVTAELPTKILKRPTPSSPSNKSLEECEEEDEGEGEDPYNEEQNKKAKKEDEKNQNKQ